MHKYIITKDTKRKLQMVFLNQRSDSARKEKETMKKRPHISHQSETKKMVEQVHQRVCYDAYLKESSVFREIVALNQYDMEWLKELGIVAVEGMKADSSSLERIYQSYRLESPLWDVVERQSKKVLELFTTVYAVGEPNEPREAWMTIAFPKVSVAEKVNASKLYKGYELYRVYTKPEDALVYMPIIEDFVRYYIRAQPKEGKERIELLRIIEQQVHQYRSKKPIWIRVPPERIVDRNKRHR